MKGPVSLNRVDSQRTPFCVVATIVGINGPRHIQSASGITSTLITLSISDGTTPSEVELTLWESDCVRAATLQMLDIVLIRDAIFKPVDRAAYVTRLALCGGEASVRLLSDAYITNERHGDLNGKNSLDVDVLSAAVSVMQWRDSQYKILVGLRRQGGMWSYDKPRHSDTPLLLSTRCDVSHKKPKLSDHSLAQNRDAIKSPNNLNIKPITLMDVLQNKSDRCYEISDVRVTNIYIRSTRMSGQKCYVTQEALVDGCWRGCLVCNRNVGRASTEDGQCAKCRGTIEWRFGPVVFAINDGSTTASAKLSDEDFQTLLFGTTADNIRKNQEVAQWTSGMLISLAQGKHKFTALVRHNSDDDNVDLWLRRLFL